MAQKSRSERNSLNGKLIIRSLQNSGIAFQSLLKTPYVGEFLSSLQSKMPLDLFRKLDQTVLLLFICHFSDV
jgi:hypothetical protein